MRFVDFAIERTRIAAIAVIGVILVFVGLKICPDIIGLFFGYFDYNKLTITKVIGLLSFFFGLLTIGYATYSVKTSPAY